MGVVFTFPGKTGDALMQWPVAYQWAKKTGKKFSVWMDERSCKMLAPLFSAQPCVESVEFKKGIENYNCGGQPWHFDLDTSEIQGSTVYHLGLRSFPARQLTLQCLEDCKVGISIDRNVLAKEPSLFVDGELTAPSKANRVALHGQPICGHNKQTPQFWKFLSLISEDLQEEFEEVTFVGSARDRAVGIDSYPEWDEFDDGGDFLELARLIQSSKLVIGCGSSTVALAGAMKIPCIRVHDEIGDNPKTIWSNLGDNQMNESEMELRTKWRPFFDKWVRKSVAEVVE